MFGLVVAVLWLAGCAPSDPRAETQPFDEVPAQFLRLLRAGDATAFELCADNVSLYRSLDEVRGRALAREALANVVIPASAGIEKHHEVAHVSLGDGSLLFVRSNGGEDGTLVDAIALFTPGPSLPTPPTIKAYQDAWNMDGAAREPLLAEGWAESGRYIDPSIEGYGRQGLTNVIDGFRRDFPGAVLAAEGQVERLPGGWVTFAWTIALDGDELEGFDVGQVDESERLVFIAGFFSARER